MQTEMAFVLSACILLKSFDLMTRGCFQWDEKITFQRITKFASSINFYTEKPLELFFAVMMQKNGGSILFFFF